MTGSIRRRPPFLPTTLESRSSPARPRTRRPRDARNDGVHTEAPSVPPHHHSRVTVVSRARPRTRRRPPSELHAPDGWFDEQVRDDDDVVMAW